ncbi:MFS transporter [Nocardioides alkalitolerans]|uniref:MFS transporter n=1 Tax=Nocardioides alkalitolerans TaxID=281714 RepID=UPI0004258B7B|nr:MFS transporter [Nocardioides alkalitolerans]
MSTSTPAGAPAAPPSRPADSAEVEELRGRVRRKTLLRLMPFLLLCYFVNYLDRSNIGIAGPNGMNDALGLTATMFGFASGIFFVGYILLEVPSNLALHKFGARKWIARILISWGIVATATAFVSNAPMLYVLRFLLGIAEAGFTPGILLYLTYWFTQRNRAQAFAFFLVGIPLSSTIGAPLAAWLISVGDGLLLGLEGWRFMILITGLPAVLLGLLCLFVLCDRPQDAKWLTPEEKALLAADLAAEGPSESHHGVRGVLRNSRVWVLGLCYFGLVYGLYAIAFFLPTIIAGFQERFGVEYSVTQVGLLTAIPYGFAVVFTLFWASHSRRTDEVPLHVAVSGVMGAVGIVVAILAGSPVVTLVGVAIAAMGLCSGIPISFGMSTKFLAGAAAAAGLALINTVGNLGGFLGPFIYGWVKDLTGSDDVGLYLIAGLCLMSSVIAWTVSRWSNLGTPAASGTPGAGGPATPVEPAPAKPTVSA